MKLNNIILCMTVVLLLTGQAYSLVHCDGKMSCLDNQTCCQLSSGKWGCCHYASAQCCEDRKTCCPSGKNCTPKGLNGRSTCVPASTFLPSELNTFNALDISLEQEQ